MSLPHNALMRLGERSEAVQHVSEQRLAAAPKAVSSVAPTKSVFIVGDRLASALARIASASKPRSGGGFSQMSRRDMIDLARIACAVGGIKCSPGAAWAGERAPERFAKPKKLRLRGRAP